MSSRVTPRSSALADRLALAIVECGPLPCARLARLVEARKAIVLATLDADPRFAHDGAGRGSRWQLTLPPSGAGEHLGTILSAGLGAPVDPELLARLEAVETRLSEVEQQLAEQEAPTT